MAKRIVFIPALFLLSSALFAQQQGGQGQNVQGNQGAGNQNQATGQQQTQQASFLSVENLDDFEESEDWRARSTCPLGETKILKITQRGDIRTTDDENEAPPSEEALSADKSDNPNHILGVKTFFDNRGFDRVELSPPHEYVIKGKARQFSVWVLGRKFRHTMGIKLRDYRGNVHLLPLGRLDFFGWRKFTVTVPGWLPQSTRYSMLDKNLHFVSLFVTSDVHEVPGTFYFYVDGLKALVDRGEQSYPGSEIKDNW